MIKIAAEVLIYFFSVAILWRLWNQALQREIVLEVVSRHYPK